MKMIDDQLEILYNIFTSTQGYRSIAIICANDDEVQIVKDYITNVWRMKWTVERTDYCFIRCLKNDLTICTQKNCIKFGRHHIGLCSANIDEVTMKELIIPVFNLSFPCGLFYPEELEELNES